jgi:hypothetical protein
MVEVRWDKLLDNGYCSECYEFIPAGATVLYLADDKIRHTNLKYCNFGKEELELLPGYVVLDSGLVVREWGPEDTIWGEVNDFFKKADKWELASIYRAEMAVIAENKRNQGKDWSHVDFSGEYPVVKQGVRPKIWDKN